MTTQDIYNALKVTNHLTTAGQPTEAQLRTAAEEGFQAIINLAMPTSDNALKNEGEIVQSLGMTYHSIPVNWENPTESDFTTFDSVMQQLSGQKILLHCAANFRATAFYGLYAMKHLGWTAEQADTFRTPIWQDSEYPIWETFIQGMKNKIG
ncbi:MAG: protein tyrosine phosphatase family protein [Anaerolineales bacterium]|nr:protein tyrosine phosphatase family protein [Anaerolineales bacterium]